MNAPAPFAARTWAIALACGGVAWVAMLAAGDDVAFTIGFVCAAGLALGVHWEVNR